MKLFLASEAKHPQTIEKLKSYIDGFEGKSIAYIPTAANGEESFGEWREQSATWQLVQTLGLEVVAVQLEDYKDSSVMRELENKDILWFAGGQCGYLMYWIRRCEIDKHIKRLLKKSIYVGSSAGSMICSPTLDICEWYIGETEIGASAIPGLGLVDFDIYPHFEYAEDKLDEIKRRYKGNKMYFLKNGEEIIVEDRKVHVNGEERIFTP